MERAWRGADVPSCSWTRESSSTAEGSLEELQVLDGSRDTESNGLVTLHMQVVTLRHRLIMHVSSRDTFIQAKAEVQDIARAR